MNKTNNTNIMILDNDLVASRKVLFEFALNWTTKNYTIFYITTKKIEQFPVTATTGSTSCRVDYKKIIFFYFEKYSALLTFLMELHCWTSTPKLLIIESIHNYLDTKKGPEVWVKECALLIATAHNAVESCSQKLKEKCFSVISLVGDKVPVTYQHTKKEASKGEAKVTYSCLDVIADLYFYKIRPLSSSDIDLKKLNK
jgi:hypothetical protein